MMKQSAGCVVLLLVAAFALAAHGLGLGAVWTGVYPGEERIASTRAILGIPEGYEPLNIIPIGYPAEDPPVKNKWNPAKVHYDRW